MPACINRHIPACVKLTISQIGSNKHEIQFQQTTRMSIKATKAQATFCPRNGFSLKGMSLSTNGASYEDDKVTCLRHHRLGAVGRSGFRAECGERPIHH